MGRESTLPRNWPQAPKPCPCARDRPGRSPCEPATHPPADPRQPKNQKPCQITFWYVADFIPLSAIPVFTTAGQCIGHNRLASGLSGLGGATSLCARTRGEPSSAHCEQRLSERLTPCPGDPVCACTGMRGQKTTRISVSDHIRSAASRAVMAGWAGEGGGRFGERREYEAPTLPSTPRQHGMARPPHMSAEKQHGHTTICRNHRRPRRQSAHLCKSPEKVALTEYSCRNNFTLFTSNQRHEAHHACATST